LYWACRGAIGEDYRVFAHLVDEQGRTWGQWDNAPLAGRFATTLWQSGMVLRDEAVVPTDAAPAGAYSLHVGLIKSRNGKRLSTQGTGGGADHFTIGPITVR
ncbi:MAG: hypothetical protein KJ734_07080, partial [Chloroflexi bacterium]|nr:hypothetical protein [Chloroflexota bacterium]